VRHDPAQGRGGHPQPQMPERPVPEPTGPRGMASGRALLVVLMRKHALVAPFPDTAVS
jgi:hypothetical protein